MCSVASRKEFYMIRRILHPASIALLSLLFVGVGCLHFLQPQPFVRIVPQFLPVPLLLVWISGIVEVLGGIGLLIPKWRRRAGLSLIVLLICVFPANVNMAVKHIYIGWLNNDYMLWTRLPLQILLIAWVEWARHPRFSADTTKVERAVLDGKTNNR
jgi:uncharacterized membrane protein